MKNALILGLFSILLLSCGKKEDQYDAETGESVTINELAKGDNQGGYCTDDTSNYYLLTLADCSQTFENTRQFEICEASIFHFEALVDITGINCYVKVPRKQNYVYHITVQEWASYKQSADIFKEKSTNYKEGQCGIFVINEISDLYKYNVDFEKKLYSPQFLEKSKRLFKKYEGINCRVDNERLFDDEYFTRLNADIQFGFKLAE